MSDMLLRVDNVSQHFGGLIAVSEVNAHIKKGDIVGIIGPNGAGKTTLFNNITGLCAPTMGKIYFEDRDITGMKPHQITQLGMARTFQNIRLCKGMTALENVMVGTHCRVKSNLIDALFRTATHKRAEKTSEEKAVEVLKLTDLYEYRYDMATSLPYGCQRRLEIARAMASDPKILLLDEPAAGMNEQETTDLMNFILKVRDMGYTILLIEHDMRLVMSICDYLYVLDHGALIAEGLPADIRKNPQVIEAYLGKEV